MLGLLVLLISPLSLAGMPPSGPGNCAISSQETAESAFRRVARARANGLSDYDSLPEELKARINRQLFFENRVLSRTASSGTSSKTFTLSAAEIQSVASRNAAEAYEMILQAAARPVLPAKDIVDFLMEVNQVFNKGIESITSSGQLGLPGELRSYGYLPGDLGLQGQELQAHIRTRLGTFSAWLAEELKRPVADPISLAAQAHFVFANEIKPFHDGSGRTARAVVDLVLLRNRLPLPRYAHAGEDSLSRYFEAASSGRTAIEGYLRDSLNATERTFRAARDVDLDVSNLVSLAITLNRPGFDSDTLKTVRLKKGDVTLGEHLGTGRSGTAYCLPPDCARVIKLPVSILGALTFPGEIHDTKETLDAGFRVARILEAGGEDGGAYLIKERVPGVALNTILEKGPLSGRQTDALAGIYHRMLKKHVPLDHNPWNLRWDESRHRLGLVEAGRYKELDDWFLDIASWKHYYFDKYPELLPRFTQKVNQLRAKEGLPSLEF